MREDIKVEDLSESFLERNLTALALRAPELCQWLRALPETPTVEMQSSASGLPNVLLKEIGNVFLHSPVDPIEEAEEEASRLESRNHQPIVCLGVGLGYYLQALLRRHNPCQPVAAYERNPWLLYLTLMRADFSRDILAGRLRFLSPMDMLSSRPEDEHGFQLWPHPVLGPLYAMEKRLLTGQSTGAGPYNRAMVITGGLFSLDVAEALQEKGVEVVNWQPAGSDQQIMKEIVSSAPDLIVSINYRHGLAELSSALGIPLLVWEVDPTIERLPLQPTRSPFTYIYTYRKANVEKFREAGFMHVEYLPLATNPKRRYPMDLSGQELENYSADISFVGSSMVDQADVLQRQYAQLTQSKDFPGKPRSPLRDYSQLWELALERQRQNPDCYVIEEIFKEHLLDGSWVTADPEQRLVDLAFCTAETSASHRRAQILTSLSQLNTGARVRVWGDEGWRSLLPDKMDYGGTVGHFYELTSLYNASRINLDINRIYQRDIVTMRVFDVLACRGFLLADFSDELGELFTLDSEVVAYRSVSEVSSLAQYFLEHPDERDAMAKAGYRRVLRDHTISLRIDDMLSNLP